MDHGKTLYHPALNQVSREKTAISQFMRENGISKIIKNPLPLSQFCPWPAHIKEVQLYLNPLFFYISWQNMLTFNYQ